MAKAKDKDLDTAVSDPGKPKRKITIKEVCGSVKGNAALMKEIIDAAGQAVPLMDVYGVASRAKPGETDKGEFVKFIGKFKAINLSSGEVFRSSACILPNFLADDLFGAMTSAEGLRNAQFAFRIGVYYAPDAVTQYQYSADPLIEPQEADALTALEAQVQAGIKALAAPK